MHNNRVGGGKFGKVTFFLILGILIVLIVEAVVLRFQVVSVKKACSRRLLRQIH